MSDVANLSHGVEQAVNTSQAVGHVDPVVPILLALILIFVSAKLGAVIAEALRQPSVLGELVAGVVIGNLGFFGINCFDFILASHTIEIFAALGVIILLFEVGLESNIGEMLEVGLQSLLVAIVGVLLPFFGGYYAAALVVPGVSDIGKIFMGAILTATSVGITARVFKDLDFIKAAESRIVLGAAVIDDILGLIILAVVSGLAVTGSISVDSVVGISLKAIGFVIVAVIAGRLLATQTFKILSAFKIPGMMLISCLTLCFIGAYFANQVGLATIVGAFAVGLILDDVHFKPFESKTSIEDFIIPISLFFVPVFFVLTGMQVDLGVFADIEIVKAALIISAVAIGGKVVSGWCFPSKTKLNRLLIGVGMVPRGEVGLIFATVGKSIGVVDDTLYAITVIMVIVTTLIAPPILGVLIKK